MKNNDLLSGIGCFFQLIGIAIILLVVGFVGRGGMEAIIQLIK